MKDEFYSKKNLRQFEKEEIISLLIAVNRALDYARAVLDSYESLFSKEGKNEREKK